MALRLPAAIKNNPKLAGTPIIMLTSAGRMGERRRAAGELDIAGYLLKARAPGRVAWTLNLPDRPEIAAGRA